MFSDNAKKLGASFRDLAFATPTTKGNTVPLGKLKVSSLGISLVDDADGGVKGPDDYQVAIQENQVLVRGSDVVRIIKPEEVCCGLIGNTGTKFCVQLASDCTKATHTLPVNKFPAESGLYVSDKRSGCFMDPFLDISHLDSEVVERILGLTGDFELLRKEFVLLNSQDGSQDSDIDLYARSNLKKANNFKTPAKELGRAGGFNPSRLTEAVDSLVALGTIQEARNPVKFEGESDLIATVSKLVNEVENVGKIIPTIAGVVDTIEESLNDKTVLIYGGLQQIKQLEGTIGNQSDVLKNAGMEPTLWGAVSNVVLAVKDLSEKSQAEELRLKEDLQSLEARASNLVEAQTVTELKLELVNILQTWKTTIQNLQQEVVDLNIKLTSSSRPTPLPSATMGMLSTLGISMPTAPSLPTTSPSPPSTTIVTTPGVGSHHSITTELEVINDRIKQMEKQHREHGKEGLNGAVRFSGVTLSGKDDLGAWLDKNTVNVGGIPPYGLFADPQLLLHWIWVLLSGTTTSTARDMKDRLSISMSQDKTYAVDSYQHYVPLVFTGKKSSLLSTGGMEKSRLGTIPTFESWDDATGETGLKQQLAEGLVLVKDSISDLIDETFGEEHEVRAFALAMLHTSCSFIEKLGTYMSETYNNFKDVMGNGKSVWGLVTFVVEQIFRKDFGQVRAKTIGAIDANNRASGIKIIWSSIRCVDVAQQFMANGIKNAPAVSASYVRFVITHSNMGKVNTIVEENKVLKRKVDDLETTVASIKKIAEGAKKLADQAVSTANATKRQRTQTPGNSSS